MVAANPLIGTWRLIAMEAHAADGRVHQPFGAEPVGYIIYTAEGRMSATLMRGTRPPFGMGFRPGQGLPEKASAFDSYLSYAGRYDFLGDRVLHHIEVALIPDWPGRTLERLVDLQGPRLTLISPPSGRAGQRMTTRITWERVGRV